MLILTYHKFLRSQYWCCWCK